MTPPNSEPTRPGWLKPILLGLAVVIALGIVLVVEIRMTAPVRGAVRAYTRLLNAANRGDLEAVRALCTASYLQRHPPRLAKEGGVEGMPRTIHKNYQAWREGQAVLLCPSNRVGPVFQFLPSSDGWKFDGFVGLLQPGNIFNKISPEGPGDLDPEAPAKPPGLATESR